MKQRGRTYGTLGNLHRVRMAGYDYLGLCGRRAGRSEGAAASATAVGDLQTIYGWTILTRRDLPSSTTMVCGLEPTKPPCLTGGLLTAAMPKAFDSLMRILRLCPHAHVGWPIRCNGEEMPSQHCFDCGAQRTYRLQPSMQRGPWKRPEPCSSYRLEIAFSSTVQSGSVPPEQLAIS